MRKTNLFLVLLTALILSACGSQTPATQPISVQPSTAPAQTTTSDATTLPTAQAGDKVPVQVTLGDNWVKSDVTTFKVGVTYVFTVTNTGRRAHSFSISHPAEKTTDAINAARAKALYIIDEDQLTPGTVKTFEFTFTEAAPAGTLEFACLIPMHYKMGQLLGIVVEP